MKRHEFERNALSLLQTRGEQSDGALRIALEAALHKKISRGLFYTNMEALKTNGFIHLDHKDSDPDATQSRRKQRLVAFYKITALGLTRQHVLARHDPNMYQKRTSRNLHRQKKPQPRVRSSTPNPE